VTSVGTIRPPPASTSAYGDVELRHSGDGECRRLERWPVTRSGRAATFWPRWLFFYAARLAFLMPSYDSASRVGTRLFCGPDSIR